MFSEPRFFPDLSSSISKWSPIRWVINSPGFEITGGTLQHAGVTLLPSGSHPSTDIVASGIAKVNGSYLYSIAPQTVQVTGASDILAINSQVNCNGNLLTKTGAGALILSNGSNTISQTNIKGGALYAATPNSIGGDVVFSGSSGKLYLGDSGGVALDAQGLLGRYYDGSSMGQNKIRTIDQFRSNFPAMSATYQTVTTTNGRTDLSFNPDGSDRAWVFADQGYNRAEQYAALFSGQIFAPKDGLYKFSTRSDDGSMLYVDGAEVVSNDYDQGMNTRVGYVQLTQGWHPITTMMYQGVGGAGFVVRWNGEDPNLDPNDDPDTMSVIKNSYLRPFVSSNATITSSNNVELNGADGEVALVYDAQTGPMSVTLGTLKLDTVNTFTASGFGSLTFSGGIQTANSSIVPSLSVGQDTQLVTGSLPTNASGRIVFAKTGAGELSYTGYSTDYGNLTVGGNYRSSNAAINLFGNITAPSSGAIYAGTPSAPQNLVLNTSPTITVAAGSTLSLTSPVIQDASNRSLTKNGPGALVLGNAIPAGTPTPNNWSNGTLVNDGNLVAKGPITLPGKVTLAGAGGATLTLEPTAVSGVNGIYFTSGTNSGDVPANKYSLQTLHSTFDSLTPAVRAATTTGGQTNLDFSNSGYGTTGAFANQGLTATNDYTAIFEGDIFAPESKVYQFATQSDDGSMIWVDGKSLSYNALYQGNDIKGTGEIFLAAGYHHLIGAMSQGGGGQGWVLSWNGSGFMSPINNSELRTYTSDQTVYTNDIDVKADATISVRPLGEFQQGATNIQLGGNLNFDAVHTMSVTGGNGGVLHVFSVNWPGQMGWNVGAQTTVDFQQQTIDGLATFGMVKSGAGAVQFSAATQCVMGQLNINGGSVLADDLKLQAGITSGPTPGSSTIGGVTSLSSGKVTFAVPSTISQAAGGSLAIASKITGAGALEKIGAGQVIFNNAVNDYSSTTKISAGELVSTGPGTLSTSNVVLNGGSLAVAPSLSVLPAATITGFGGDGTGWTLNNGVTVTGDVASLTEDINGQNRSMFKTDTVSLSNATGFTATFTYRATGNLGADGAAFILQNDPRGAAALGDGGGALGYAGTTAKITPSAALAINIYDGNTPGAGFTVNGAQITAPYPSVAPVNLKAEHDINVLVQYDGALITAMLTDSVTGDQKIIRNAADLVALLGTNNPFIGFSGATGGANSQQNVSNFTFAPSLNNTYANNVSTTAGTSSTIEVASKVNMGTLTAGAGSTLNVTPYVAGMIADVPYTLTLGATSLLGTSAATDTINVAKNGTGIGTLILGDIAASSANVAKGGDGTLVYSGAVGYTGTTTINDGVLKVLSPSATLAVITGSDTSTLQVGDATHATVLTASSISVGTLIIGAPPAGAAAAAVPEPGAMILLVLAGFMAVGVRFIRRK